MSMKHLLCAKFCSGCWNILEDGKDQLPVLMGFILQWEEAENLSKEMIPVRDKKINECDVLEHD